MAQKTTPDWGSVASRRVKHLEQLFRDSVRRIAVRFAHHDRADTIDAKHVDEAYRALVRFGMKQDPWWKRSELKITAAAGIIGLAINLPDWVPMFSDDPNVIRSCAIGGIVSGGIISGALWVWGWCQDQL